MASTVLMLFGLAFYVWYERVLEEIATPDDLPQLDRPIITLCLIAACAGVFLLEALVPLARAQQIVALYGTVPAVITGSLPAGDPLAHGGRPHAALTLLTGAFLHGSAGHLFGNMIFLWIFGRHFDDLTEWYVYLGLVVVCAVGASLTEVAINPHSVVPTIGASGFIAGLMGAYLVLFPKAKLYQYWRAPGTATPITFALPAWVYILGWAAIQLALFHGLGDKNGGTAFSAHLGGFVIGAGSAWLLVRSGVLAVYGPDDRAKSLTPVSKRSAAR